MEPDGRGSFKCEEIETIQTLRGTIPAVSFSTV
jgi:hypothetical protein